MQSLDNAQYRKEILDEIYGNENKKRKAESYKRSEIMRNRHEPYVISKLKGEFSDKTVNEMRKVTSINVAPRMIEEQAKVYLEKPQRKFIVDGRELEGDAAAQALEFYNIPDVDTKLLKFHRVLKYQKQAFLQVVPTRGIFDVRVYQPHQLDVIPMDNDPEIPFAYIITAYDRAQSLSGGDGQDQKTADRNDGESKERAKARHVWWSAEHNMITDGYGVVVSGDDITNPIQRLPFVEGNEGKENEFWVRSGSPDIDFSIDAAVALSDLGNIVKLQGYAQGVLASFEKPTEMVLGPNHVFHVQLEREQTVQPSFQFVSPSPDIAGSLQYFDTLINIFLTAKGIDPKTVNSKGESQSFASGFERLLATLKDFEASREDIAQLLRVERELFELFLAWHEAFKGTTNSPLNEEYKKIELPKECELLVEFKKPELVQTKKETEESIAMLEEKGYRSKVMSLMSLDNLTEDQAIEKLNKIAEHKALFAPKEELAGAYAVGSRVSVDPTKAHMPEASGAGTVKIVEGKMLGISFDKNPSVVHKWYSSDEVTSEGGSQQTNPMKMEM